MRSGAVWSSHSTFPRGFPLALSQSFHSIQMDDSLACLFFLAVYAATSNRGCLPGKAISGEDAVLTEATNFAW